MKKLILLPFLIVNCSLIIAPQQAVAQPLVVTITDNTITCWSGGPGNDLAANATGGTGNRYYQWYDSGWTPLSTYQNFYPYSHGYGTFHVVATDDGSGRDTASITLTYEEFSIQLEPVILSNGTHATCNGEDGSIEVEVTGGSGPFRVQVYGWQKEINDFWVSDDQHLSPNQLFDYYESSGSFTIDSLPPGVIHITVTSENGEGCMSGRTTFLEAMVPAVTLTGELHPNGYYVSCDTCADGTFTIHTTEVTEPATYIWGDVDSVFTPDIFVSGSTLAIPWHWKEGHEPDQSEIPGLIIAMDTTVSSLKADHWYIAGVIDANGCHDLKPLKIEKPRVPSGVWAATGNVADSTHVLGTVNGEPLRIITNDTVRITIAADGAVGIGTDEVPEGYLLAVNGRIIAEEVEVKLNGDWPDYVFDEGYPLMSLEQLEAYIQQHGHLPGFPSAAELEAKGTVSSGQMVKTLVEKVEELSLHVIQLQKEVNALKQQNMDFSDKMKRMHHDVKSRGGNGFGNGGN